MYIAYKICKIKYTRTHNINTSLSSSIVACTYTICVHCTYKFFVIRLKCEEHLNCKRIFMVCCFVCCGFSLCKWTNGWKIIWMKLCMSTSNTVNLKVYHTRKYRALLNRNFIDEFKYLFKIFYVWLAFGFVCLMERNTTNANKHIHGHDIQDTYTHFAFNQSKFDLFKYYCCEIVLKRLVLDVYRCGW